MSLLYLCTLCLYMAGLHLDAVGSNMCDYGWVYHSNTSTCLQLVSGVITDGIVWGYEHPCRDKTGGEFRNESGKVVQFTEAIEPFLRNYLQYMEVPAAAVKLSSTWLRRSVFTYDRYSTPPVCPRDVKPVSVSDRNATLSWSPGQLGRQVVVYITVQICEAPSSCRNLTEQRFGEVSLFQPMNYTVTGLQPNTTYIFDLQIQNDTVNKKDCNETLSLTTNEEPPVCPRQATLVSVSETNAVLSVSYGQQGVKVIVKIDVQICVSLSCDYFTTRIFVEKSTNQLMNYAVSGLQPNTKYKLVLQVMNDTFETKDCNMTLAVETNEESSAAVIWLAVMFSISLIACSVMAILQFRHYRQAQKDKNSDIDKIVAKVMRQTTSKQETKLQEQKIPETNNELYLNVQEEPHEYETTTDTLDEHIYEA